MTNDLPSSVRYIKNGVGGQWWSFAKAKGQLHAGWSIIPRSLLEQPNFSEIEKILREFWDKRDRPLKKAARDSLATRDFNALCWLLDHPSKHLWITIERGFMWWCTVRDGVQINPDGESVDKGNFWLRCERPWSNCSLTGETLSTTDLPGDVTAVKGFRGTISRPRAERKILRIIGGEKDPAAVAATYARREYERSIKPMVQQLTPQDFELLISLILERTGWLRLSRVGGQEEGIDLEVENWAVDERAFVQVKSSANQATLDDYVERFRESPQYARLIFAVHTPIGNLAPPVETRPVHLWDGERLAHLVMRLGLGEWIERKLA
jgi:hypothetical protein